MSNFAHDPSAVLDYAVDWSDWLDSGETISASTWTVATGITQTTPSPSNTTTTATIWITGGTAGTYYQLVNHITTSAGRQDDRTITLRVAQR